MEEKDAGVAVAGLQVTSFPCYQFSLPLARKNGAVGRHRRRKKTQAEQADWMCCSMYWSCAGCDCEPLELSICTYASASENTHLCWESGWCKILNKHCHVREMDMCNKPHSGSQKSGDMRKQSSWYPQSKTSGTSPKSSQACHHKAVMLQRGPNFTLFFTWPFLYFYSASLLVCLKEKNKEYQYETIFKIATKSIPQIWSVAIKTDHLSTH